MLEICLSINVLILRLEGGQLRARVARRVENGGASQADEFASNATSRKEPAVSRLLPR